MERVNLGAKSKRDGRSLSSYKVLCVISHGLSYAHLLPTPLCNCDIWDFPGSLLVRTPYSHCQGPGFDAWSGNEKPHKLRGMAKETNKNPDIHSVAKFLQISPVLPSLPQLSHQLSSSLFLTLQTTTTY